MNKKQSIDRLNTLVHNYQKEMKKQSDIQNYYRRTLDKLQIRRRHLEGLVLGTSSLKQDQQNIFDRVSQKSIMSDSKISLSVPPPFSNKQKEVVAASTHKNQGNSFQMEYKNHAKNIAKHIQNMTQKQQKLNFIKTTNNSKKNSSILNKSMKSSRIINKTKEQTTSPYNRLKTETQINEFSKKQTILSELSNEMPLQGEDDIVNNLLKNLQKQEEKYVDNVLAQTEYIAKQKITNFMLLQSEKNEEILFKMRQQIIDKSLNKLQSNKETVRSGYTTKMKQIVQFGLKTRSILL